MEKDDVNFRIGNKLSTIRVMSKLLTSWPPRLKFKGTGIGRFTHPVEEDMIRSWFNEVLDV